MTWKKQKNRSDYTRIVSQDGTIDIPYDICAFSIGENVNGFNIYARSKLLDEKPCLYATYKTEEKAMKSMDMLRNQYAKFEVAKVIACGSSEVLANGVKQQKLNDIISQFWEITIFQFPQDDEIEV